ncbi:MAG: ACT domain-containing protein [Luteimonas sp.]
MDAASLLLAPGETDLHALLSGMQPRLHDVPQEFIHVSGDQVPQLQTEPLMVFREREGTTFIIASPAIAPGEESGRLLWAQITLDVQSSLSSVGMMAAASAALAARGIACNPVSAYLHDHLFVPWERRHDALDALANLHS